MPRDSRIIGMRGSPFERIPKMVTGVFGGGAPLGGMVTSGGYLQGGLLEEMELRKGRTSWWRS